MIHKPALKKLNRHIDEFTTKEDVASLIEAYPEAMARPIARTTKGAVIARPVGRIEELL